MIRESPHPGGNLFEHLGGGFNKKHPCRRLVSVSGQFYNSGVDRHGGGGFREREPQVQGGAGPQGGIAGDE